MWTLLRVCRVLLSAGACLLRCTTSAVWRTWHCVMLASQLALQAWTAECMCWARLLRRGRPMAPGFWGHVVHPCAPAALSLKRVGAPVEAAGPAGYQAQACFVRVALHLLVLLATQRHAPHRVWRRDRQTRLMQQWYGSL